VVESHEILGLRRLPAHPTGSLRSALGYIPSWELTCPPCDGMFESMILLFPRWDMLVPWRVGDEKVP